MSDPPLCLDQAVFVRRQLFNCNSEIPHRQCAKVVRIETFVICSALFQALIFGGWSVHFVPISCGQRILCPACHGATLTPILAHYTAHEVVSRDGGGNFLP